MIEGIDVSAHQRTTPSLAGRSFLIARATYGTIPDRLYPTHARAARAAGVVLGAYHFGRAYGVAAQVRAFLESIARVPPDLVVLDLESDGNNAPMTSSEARDFIDAIQSTGRPCGLYHSTSGYPRDSLGADWRWVADYRPLDEPPIPWDVWQFTSSGGKLDRNRFRGTADELAALGRREDPMGRTFALLPESTSGRITLRTDRPHDFLRVADWSIQGPIIPGPAWVDRPAFGPVVLVPDQAGHPGARWYLIGTNAALLLEADVVWTPDAGAGDPNLDAELETIASGLETWVAQVRKLKGGNQ